MLKPNKSFARSQIILASASPRRRKLMKEHGFRFRVFPSHVAENGSKSLSPSALVRMLAVKKAVFVSKKKPHDVVLGADTIVYINKKVIGKPKSPKDAERILRQLSGAWQRVYTGVAVVWEGGQKKRVGHAVSYVKLRALTEKDIQLAARQHMDKAGAYAVQQKRDPFVEKIRGDFDNVVGLPMKLVKRLLGSHARRFKSK